MIPLFLPLSSTSEVVFSIELVVFVVVVLLFSILETLLFDVFSFEFTSLEIPVDDSVLDDETSLVAESGGLLATELLLFPELTLFWEVLELLTDGCGLDVTPPTGVIELFTELDWLLVTVLLLPELLKFELFPFEEVFPLLLPLLPLPLLLELFDAELLDEELLELPSSSFFLLFL